MNTFSNEDLMQRIEKLDAIVNANAPYINTYGPSVICSDPVKSINESMEEQINEIESLKNTTAGLDCRTHNIEGQMYEIREKVEEALTIMKYPGLIANRMLDKVDSFIAKHKKVLTDSTGTKIEMVEVSRLNEMMRQLREVVKNGNNNERL